MWSLKRAQSTGVSRESSWEKDAQCEQKQALCCPDPDPSPPEEGVWLGVEVGRGWGWMGVKGCLLCTCTHTHTSPASCHLYNGGNSTPVHKS